MVKYVGRDVIHPTRLLKDLSRPMIYLSGYVLHLAVGMMKVKIEVEQPLGTVKIFGEFYHC